SAQLAAVVADEEPAFSPYTATHAAQQQPIATSSSAAARIFNCPNSQQLQQPNAAIQ
ncbi:hypothetical protein Dimus_003096, partial [Dionaea muscipula]